MHPGVGSSVGSRTPLMKADRERPVRQASCMASLEMPINHTSGVAPDAADHAVCSPDSSLTPAVDELASANPAAPGAPPPDLRRTVDALDRSRSRSIEATLLTVLAV